MSTQSYDSLILADGPISYWKMDEASGTAVADAKSYVPLSVPSQPGVLRGQPALAPGLGLSISLDATTPTRGALTGAVPTILTPPFTWEGWVAPDAVGYNFGNLISNWPGVFNAGLDHQYTTSFYGFGAVTSNQLARPGTEPAPDPLGTQVTGNFPAPISAPGTTMYLALVVDATTMTLYHNGVQIASGPHGDVNPKFWGPGYQPRFMLGQAEGGQVWGGRASNWAVYNKVLSAAQIQAHWTNAQTVYVPPPPAWTMGLVASPAGGSVLNPPAALTYTMSAQNTGGVVLTGQTATLDLTNVLPSATLGTLPAGVTQNGNVLTWAIPSTALSATSTAVIPLTLKADAWSRTLSAVATAGPNGSPATVTVTHTTRATPPPKIGTLVDSFDTQIDPAKWTTQGRVIWQDRRVALTEDPTLTSIMASTGQYDLTESAVFAKVSPDTGTEVWFAAFAPNSDRPMIGYVAGSLWFYLFAGGQWLGEASVAYDPVAHAWWRIRMTSGVLYWETAPDGATWTVRQTLTPAGSVDLTSTQVDFYAPPKPNGRTTYIDSVNVAPYTGTLQVTAWVKGGVLPPQVEIYIEGSALSGALTTLERVLPDGTATVVRGFQSYPTTGPIYVTDFEAPFYTDLRYRATAVSTVTQVSYGPNQSVFPTGQVGTSTTDTAGYSVGNDITIAAAGRITAVRYLRPANATGVNKPVKLWRSPEGILLGTATTDATTSAGWKTGYFATPIAVSAGQKVRAAVDNATGVLHNDVQPSVIISGDLTMNPPNSYFNVVNNLGTYPTSLGSWNYYIDLVFQKTTGTSPAGTVTTSPLSAVVRMCFNVAWLSDPLNPGSGVRVYVQDEGWDEHERHVDQDVFQPLGRRYPVVVSGMRKEPSYTIRLTTNDDSDTETIRTMLEQAQPALLRMAEARYGGWSGGYVAMGAWKEQRWSATFAKRTRVFEIPCWEVESPTAGAVISLWHWSDVLESYSTWGQVRTSKDSWATLLRNPTPGPR